MDDATHDCLTRLDLPGLEPIALRDFEAGDAPLLAAKRNRSRVEYYFTCTPSLLLYVLKHWPAVDLLTYLDADLFFFASPEPLFDELGTGSVAIIGHRYPPELRHKEIFGTYNVGWLAFRRDESALACLERWRGQCLEWCYDRAEGGRFADQKYLDDWPERVRNVVVLEHRGANVAPWNVGEARAIAAGGAEVTVGGDPLIFFHFHGLKQIFRWLYDPGWTAYGVVSSPVLRHEIYLPYLRAVRETDCRLPPSCAAAPDGGVRDAQRRIAAGLSRPQRVLGALRRLLGVVRDLLAGQLIVVVPCWRR